MLDLSASEMMSGQDWSNNRSRIWTLWTTLMSEPTNSVEVTRERCLLLWPWSVTHQLYSWMSQVLESTHKPRDSCGISYPRFLPRERSLLSLLPPTLWKRLRLSAPRWVSWYKVNSSALDLVSTSRTSLELVMRWRSRSEHLLRTRSVTLSIRSNSRNSVPK
jgi:hypothetical protein